MLIDAQNQFEDGSVVLSGASGTTTPSQNVIDGGQARNLGVGHDLYLVVEVFAPLVGASSTIAVAFETSPDNVTWTNQQTVGTFAALAVAGTIMRYRLQPELANAEYLRLLYTVGGATLTSAQLKASLVVDIDDVTLYPNATQITG